MGFIRSRVLEFWTKVERIVFDERGEPQVKETTCCCGSPGASRRTCADVSGNKTPCRCFCHSHKLPPPSPAARD